MSDFLATLTAQHSRGRPSRQPGLRLLAVAAIVLLALVLGPALRADDAPPSQDDRLTVIGRNLDRITAEAAEVGAIGWQRRDWKPLRQRLAALISDTDDLDDDLAAQQSLLAEQLAALGPAPASGAPPEPEPIAGHRSTLQASIAALEAQTHTAALYRIRATQLLETVAAGQRELIWQLLTLPTPNPLRPEVWVLASDQLRTIVADLGTAGAQLATDVVQARDAGLSLRDLLLLLGAGALAWAGQHRIGGRIRRGLQRPAPSVDERRHVSTLRTLRIILVPAVVLLTFLFLVNWSDLVFGETSHLLQRLVIDLLLLVLGCALLRGDSPRAIRRSGSRWCGTMCAPRRPSG